MPRARKGGLLCVLALLLGCGLSCGGGSSAQLATFRVEPQTFLHRVTAEGTLQAARATTVSVPVEVRESVRIAWLAPGGREVKAGEVIARFDPSTMESRLTQGRTELASATLREQKAHAQSSSAIDQAEKDGQMAELEVEAADRFQKKDPELYSRVERAESEIDRQLAEERREHARQMEDIRQRLGRTEVELLEIEQRQARQRIEIAETGLAALEVRAPHDGILIWQRDWRGEPPQVGGQLWSGQPLAEIPDLGRMEAEVFVLEADAGGLKVGQAAELVVEAHPDRRYAATVRRVDAVAKPRFRGSPVQYFGVTLELERTDPEVMKPGQRVRATLRLAELAEQLVVPRQAVVAGEAGPQVFVRDGGSFVARPVKLGASSAGLVVVEDGLKAGELVSLEPPSAAGGSAFGSEPPAALGVGGR